MCVNPKYKKPCIHALGGITPKNFDREVSTGVTNTNIINPTHKIPGSKNRKAKLIIQLILYMQLHLIKNQVQKYLTF